MEAVLSNYTNEFEEMSQNCPWSLQDSSVSALRVWVGGGGGMVVDVGSHMPLEALAGLKCSLGYIVNSCSYFFSSEQNVDLSTMRAICL